MARLRDWVDLGKADDVTSLYALEWPQTKDVLIADHHQAIESDQRRLRRWFRTVSAILVGLAKRLSPLRRLLFVLAQIFFIVSLAGLAVKMQSPPLRTFAEIAATFVVMTALLAMELIDTGWRPDW